MRFLLLTCFLLAALLSGCGDSKKDPPERLSWTFPAEGISKVKVRTSRAVQIRTTPQAAIKVSARPMLAANGYHAPDPAGRETPAHEWPFEVVAIPEGSTLVLTTKGETTFRQHRYFLDALEVEVPAGIEVIREMLAPVKNTP